MSLLARLFAAVALSAAVAHPAAADEMLTVGYVTKSATNQGWSIINKGAQDAARDEKVKLIQTGPATYGALEDQVNAINYVMSQGVKAIAMAPVDTVGVVPAVRRAISAGIKVVAVDTDVQGVEVSSYVATNNRTAAAAQADWVASQIADDAQIVLVNGSQLQSTGRDRREGFLDRLKQLKPGVTVFEVNTSWTFDEARNGVVQTLGQHPSVSAIVNAWDDGTLGTVAALRFLGTPKGAIKVVGFDGAPNALALIRSGWVQADVAQMLYREGYVVVKTAIAAARGETVRRRIDTGHVLVTDANLESFIAENNLKSFMD
jgi:ABC-type sugar transport system substrate-binding protein